MHARRRSFGDGVRSNSVSGRISGEGSSQGNGKYNWEYRNFNRGFGRGPPKPYPPPPKPPCKGDIFMEAGRLAAEYLVSQGLLSPNLLPGEWQSGYLKVHQMRDFPEFREQARKNPMLSSRGMKSSFDQVRNVFPQGVSARRKFSDEFSSMGHRNQMRGKRRMGPFRGLGSSDWGRENGRKRYCSEKTRALSNMLEGGDDSVGVPYEGEPQVGLDVGGTASKVITHEMVLKSEFVGNSESKIETYEFPDDVDSKASSASTRKDLRPVIDIELSKGRDDADGLNSEIKEVNDSKFVDKIEEESALDNSEKQHCSMEVEESSKRGSDLLQFCSFVKVPTKARSSLASRLLRVGQGPSIEERNGCDIASANRSKEPMKEDSGEASTLSLKSTTSDLSRVHYVRPFDEAINGDAKFVAEREGCTRPHSFADGLLSSMHQEDSSDGPPGFVTCKSMVLLNKGDNCAHHVGTWEADKRPRESPSGSEAMKEDSVEASTHDMKTLSSNISRVHSVRYLDEAVDSDATFVAGTERCTKSPSFSDVSSSLHQEDAIDSPPRFVRCKSLVLHNRGDGTREAEKIPGESPNGSEVPGEEDSVQAAIHSTKSLSTHISRVHSLRSLDEAVDLNATFVAETEKHNRSESFSDGSSSMHQEDASDGHLGLVRCKSMVLLNKGDSSARHVGTWEEDKRPGESPSRSKVPMEEDSVEASTYRMKKPPSDISRVHSVRSLEETGDSDSTFVAGIERCTRSQSSSDVSSAMHQEDANDGPPWFVGCKAMVLPNKGDGSSHHVGAWEEDKRPRESSCVSDASREEDCVQVSIYGEKNLSSDSIRVHSLKSLDEAVDLGATFVAETETRKKSQSFSDGSSLQQEDASDGSPGFVRCKSVVLLNKSDSSTHHVGTWEADKRGSKIPSEEDSVQAYIHSTKNLSSDISRVHSIRSLDEDVDFDVAFVAEAGRCNRSQSFLDGSSFICREELSVDPPGFVRCKTPIFLEKGNISAHFVSTWEEIKRHRESPSGSKGTREEDSEAPTTHSTKHLTSNTSRVHSVQSLDEVVELDAACDAKREIFSRCQSFSDGSSFMHQEESSDGLPVFVRCNSMVLPNKGDNFVHHFGACEASMQPRESPLSEVSEVDEGLFVHNLRAKQLCLEVERLSPDEKMVESVDQKKLVEGGLVPKSGAESKIAAKEVKQLSPSLFKTCDLNLMVASEIAVSPRDLIQDHVSTAPSALEVEKVAATDFGFSMISNNPSGFESFDDYQGLVGDAKEAIGVNVANNSLIQEKIFDATGQK